MVKWLGLLLVLVTLIACRQPVVPEYNRQSDGKYTLIDSATKTDNLYKYEHDPERRYGWYPVYYIGPAQSTFTLGSQPIAANVYNQLIDTTIRTCHWTDKHIGIFVDTLLDISNKVIYFHTEDEGTSSNYHRPKRVIDSVGHFKAYPVFFSNIGDSVLFLGTHNYLNFTIREAKNERGEWVPIEIKNHSFECIGCRQIFLKPNEMIVAKLIRYKGNYKTTCRLRFGSHKSFVYSNTFTDYIDKRMLTGIVTEPEYVAEKVPENSVDTAMFGGRPRHK